MEVLTGDCLAVVKAEAGTAGMDPNIFRPLQVKGRASTNAGRAVLGSLASGDSSIQRRQEEKRELDDEELQRRTILEAYAAVAKLAVLEPDDAQLAKAFIPPMRKRQASKVTVTTTTTVPPVSQYSSYVCGWNH
jgi:hypothetical protein